MKERCIVHFGVDEDEMLFVSVMGNKSLSVPNSPFQGFVKMLCPEAPSVLPGGEKNLDWM
jgi:hypothetical protein